MKAAGQDERREERRQRADKLCRDAMGRGAESHAAALACGAHLAQAKAISAWQRHFWTKPGSATRMAATPRSAGILIRMHRIDEAVTMLDERLKAYPHDSSAYFQLYRAFQARGDAKAALARCDLPLL